MTQDWKSVRTHYSDLASSSAGTALSIHGMVDLVKAVEASRFADGLFPWTSMHDLCITQLPAAYPYMGPYLRIKPLPEGRLEFRYLDSHDASKQWFRIVDSRDAFQRLELFIDQLHWFTDLRP